MNKQTKSVNRTSAEPRSLLPSRVGRQIQKHWRLIVITIPFVWLLLFFLLPFFIVAKISVAELKIASPPFSNMFEWTDSGIVTVRIVFDNFIYIMTDNLYFDTYLNSVKIAAVSTFFCLLFGYPIAIIKANFSFLGYLTILDIFFVTRLCLDGTAFGSRYY
jgi:putrescine transport system permease protein